MQPFGHFALHWASHCTAHSRFYIASLSLFFFLFWFWISGESGNLDMNVRLPSSAGSIWLPDQRPVTVLFCSTSSRALDLDLATCEGQTHGRDFSFFVSSLIPQGKSDRKSLAIVFPWIVENTWKSVAHAEGFSTLIPQTAFWPSNYVSITRVSSPFSKVSLLLPAATATDL